jgi:hypothetical protein
LYNFANEKVGLHMRRLARSSMGIYRKQRDA